MTWRDEYKRELIDTVISDGSPVGSADYYGWIHPKWDKVRKDLGSRKIDYQKSSIKESYWHEFQGTFYEGDDTVWGVDATIVTTDGKEFHWRYSGRLSDLILSLLGEG